MRFCSDISTPQRQINKAKNKQQKRGRRKEIDRGNIVFLEWCK